MATRTLDQSDRSRPGGIGPRTNRRRLPRPAGRAHGERPAEAGPGQRGRHRGTPSRRADRAPGLRCESSSGTAAPSARRRWSGRSGCGRPTRCGGSSGLPASSDSARAFVAGDLEAEGDLFAVASGPPRRCTPRSAPERSAPAAGGAACGEGARCGRSTPPATSPRSAGPPGGSTPPPRDAAVVSHHYDVGNDFYRLVLGESDDLFLCALRRRLEHSRRGPGRQARADLPEARTATSRPGAAPPRRRLRMGIDGHPRRSTPQAEVVGVSLSREQVDLARRRVAEAGLGDRVEIRLEDYRDLRGEPFDAISSIGMFEHVGTSRMQQYFETLRRLLRPEGRLLNHAISKPGGTGTRTAHLHRELRVPGRGAPRRRRGGRRDAAQRLRGARRRIAPRALLADTPPLGGQPRSRAGTRRSHWSGRLGPTSGASTWRRRPTGSTTAASRCTRCSASFPTPEACERHAADPRRVGMTRPTGLLSGR